MVSATWKDTQVPHGRVVSSGKEKEEEDKEEEE